MRETPSADDNDRSQRGAKPKVVSTTSEWAERPVGGSTPMIDERTRPNAEIGPPSVGSPLPATGLVPYTRGRWSTSTSWWSGAVRPAWRSATSFRTGGSTIVVLERGRVGQSWRDRWDSFCLVTPNWSVRLPGGPYAGPDPDGFMPRDDVVAHLVAYAAASAAPVREGVAVRTIDRTPEGFVAQVIGR